MTRDEAIKLAETEFWKDLDYRQRAEFQLFEERLCMPFGIFHEAVEKSLGRPVFTHEFGLNVDGLKAELMGEKEPTSLTEVLEMIPEEKRLMVIVDGEEE